MNPTRGFALLTTLATFLLLATLVRTLQTRSQANLRLLARLAADLQDRAAKDSLHDRLRGLIADTMSAAANPGAPTDGRPTLDGAPFVMREGGKDWLVRVGGWRGSDPPPIRAEWLTPPPSTARRDGRKTEARRRKDRPSGPKPEN